MLTLFFRILILISKRNSIHRHIAIRSRYVNQVALTAVGIGLRRHIVNSIKITAVVHAVRSLWVHRCARSPNGNATRAGPTYNLLLCIKVILHGVSIGCLLLLLLELARCCCCHPKQKNVKVFEITKIYYF